MALKRRARNMAVQKKVAGRKGDMWGRLIAGLSIVKVASPQKKGVFIAFLRGSGFKKSLSELESEVVAFGINLNDEAFGDTPGHAISASGESEFIIEARKFLTLFRQAKKRRII